MLTIVLEKPGQFNVRESQAPDQFPPGHALVRVRRVGICGTDWHAFHGRQPFFSYPRILGHELGVEIEAVNDPDSPLKPGDTCAVEPYLNCGHCVACRRGKGNCCTDLKVLGVHIDGGMREWLVIPTRKLHTSKKLTLDQLALVETLGIGCHAVARASIEPRENVLVIGAGPIGLSVIQFVMAAGADPVVADVSEKRLSFCRTQLHVTRTVDAKADLPAKLPEIFAGELPTCIIDATGNPDSMRRCFDLVAAGGRIVFVGLFQGELAFNDPNFHRREMTVLGSRNALSADFKNIIALIEQGKVDTTPWITHRAAGAALLEVLPSWLSSGDGLVKAMLEF